MEGKEEEITEGGIIASEPLLNSQYRELVTAMLPGGLFSSFELLAIFAMKI